MFATLSRNIRCTSAVNGPLTRRYLSTLRGAAITPNDSIADIINKFKHNNIHRGYLIYNQDTDKYDVSHPVLAEVSCLSTLRLE